MSKSIKQSELDVWQSKLRKILIHHKLTIVGDGVIEGDMLAWANERPQSKQVDDIEPVAWMNPHGGFLSANYIKNFATGLEKEKYNIPLYLLSIQQCKNYKRH